MTDPTSTDTNPPTGELVQLKEGQAIETEKGVAFTYYNEIPQLVVATTSTDGFAWQWLLGGGKIAIPYKGNVGTFDGLTVIGRHGNTIHALLRPAGADAAFYASVPMTDVQVETTGSSGLFNKRPKALVIDLGESITIGASEIGSISAQGTTVKWNQQAVLAAALTGQAS